MGSWLWNPHTACSLVTDSSLWSTQWMCQESWPGVSMMLLLSWVCDLLEGEGHWFKSVLYVFDWFCFSGILQGRDERDSTTVQAPSTPPSLPEHFDIRNICVGIPKVQLHSDRPLGDSSSVLLTAEGSRLVTHRFKQALVYTILGSYKNITIIKMIYWPKMHLLFN